MARKSLKSFDLGDTIGVGTVGTIYRALDRDRRRQVALKVLQEGVSQAPTVRLRFEREIEVLQKLAHPNVVEYFDEGEDSGKLFYSMELVDGGPLRDVLLQRGKLRIIEAIECGWQVCSALQHIHNHGIVHRDLKPSNLYLTRDGFVKLGDFGIALDTGASEITEQGLTVGSYLYMAPEQIRGERSVSDQTDLYALGCLLYQLLTGDPPYQGTNFARIFDQHLTCPPPSVCAVVPECPQELDELIQCLLSKSAEDRPINARFVQGILGEAMSTISGPDSIDELKDAHRKGSVRLSRLLAPVQLQPNEVSWRTIGMSAVVIVGLILLAAVFKQFSG